MKKSFYKIVLILLGLTFTTCKKIKENSERKTEANLLANDDKLNNNRRLFPSCPSVLPNAGPDKLLCPSPGSVQIGLSPVQGESYQWQPTIGLSNPYISNPIASPSSTTTYTLTTTGKNVVYNGDFELGNVGFSNEYTYFNNIGAIQPGNYFVSLNQTPSNFNGSWCVGNNGYGTYSHTLGGNRMLIVDGKTSNNTSDLSPTVFWSQTISLTSNDYQFSAHFLSTLYDNIGNDAPIVQLRVNGVNIGSPLTLNYMNCNWISYNTLVEIPSDGLYLFELIDLKRNQYGNDFAVDDIVLNCPFSQTDDVNVCVCTNTITSQTVTINIPMLQPTQLTKQDPSMSPTTCYNTSVMHSHNLYRNWGCGLPYCLMAGYVLADNGMPAYESFIFGTYIQVFSNSDGAYLAFPGSQYYDYIRQSDIQSATLKLFPYNPTPCREFSDYPNVLQPYSTYSHPFTIKRLSSYPSDFCNNITTFYNYDNLPPTFDNQVETSNLNSTSANYSINIKQMLLNSMQTNSTNIYFLFQPSNFNKYNHVIFKSSGNSGSQNILPGEPYIELKYTRRSYPQGCTVN